MNIYETTNYIQRTTSSSYLLLHLTGLKHMNSSQTPSPSSKLPTITNIHHSHEQTSYQTLKTETFPASTNVWVILSLVCWCWFVSVRSVGGKRKWKTIEHHITSSRNVISHMNGKSEKGKSVNLKWGLASFPPSFFHHHVRLSFHMFAV